MKLLFKFEAVWLRPLDRYLGPRESAPVFECSAGCARVRCPSHSFIPADDEPTNQ